MKVWVLLTCLLNVRSVIDLSVHSLTCVNNKQNTVCTLLTLMFGKPCQVDEYVFRDLLRRY